MREIKFRAWDKKLKHMDYELATTTCLGHDLNNQQGMPGRVSYLMQYTGLKDKNGVEIFDGDIVKCHKFTQEAGENLGVIEGEKEFVAKIEFSIYGGTQVITKDGNSMFVWEFEEGWHEESLEVIGNIYENPELNN